MKRLFRHIAFAMALAMIAPVAAVAVPFEVESIHGVESVPTIKVVAGGVQICPIGSEPQTFYFYSITGQLVKSITVSETTIVDLPQGCYIVKCADWSKKIVIK